MAPATAYFNMHSPPLPSPRLAPPAVRCLARPSPSPTAPSSHGLHHSSVARHSRAALSSSAQKALMAPDTLAGREKSSHCVTHRGG